MRNDRIICAYLGVDPDGDRVGRVTASIALMIVCIAGLYIDSKLRFDREIRKFFDDNS
jgi:hypothetical protein